MVSVFSTTLTLCLLSQCCAITLKMNHLPLWAHCFWPNDLPHQRRFRTNRKPQLDLISATVILWVCTRRPSLTLKWITPQVRDNKRDSHLFLNRHKNTAVAEWEAFCICNTQIHKDDKGKKQWTWVCFCWGEWLMNMSRFLHTSSWKYCWWGNEKSLSTYGK